MADTTPDLNAILDAAEAAGEPPEPAEAAPAEPEPVEPAEVEPAAAEVEPDTFPREYVEKLRRENQTYRQRAQTFEEAYEGYDDDDRAFLLNLAVDLRSDDPGTRARAAVAMQQVAESVFGTSPESTESDYLTSDQLNRILDERDARQKQTTAQEQALADIAEQAKKLGYNPDDPDDADYFVLLGLAHKNGGDIAAAHATLKEREQKIIAAYTAAKEQEAAQGSTPTPQTGAAPGAETPITSLEEARAAFEARLDAEGFR